jgi:hypothetical protein
VNHDAALAEAAELAELQEQAAQRRAELGATVHALASRLDWRRVLLGAAVPVAALVLAAAAVAVLATRRPRTRR